MDNKIKNFLEDHKDLIILNTRESWKEFYQKAEYAIRGLITEILLKANIDPANKLGYLPIDYLYGSGITSYKIPDNVTNIGEGAFYICRGLTSLSIGNGVTRIENSAFYRCSSLTNIAYKGTKEQWQAINKGDYWNYRVPLNCKVHCTDGDLNIQG